MVIQNVVSKGCNIRPGNSTNCNDSGGRATIHTAVYKDNLSQNCCSSGTNGRYRNYHHTSGRTNNNNNPYYANTAQRLKAKRMTYEQNLAIQKNRTLSCLDGPCSDYNKPISNKQYSEYTNKSGQKIPYVEAKSDSSTYTQSIKHINIITTESTESANDECVNKRKNKKTVC
jgi:hypothetical protein